MFVLPANPATVAANIGVGLLSVAVVICFVRLWIGPSLPDRIVALDVFATLLVGLLTLNAVLAEEMHPLRVATVLALVNFVGSVGFALYLRRKEKR